jgi:fucose 4-O-acetylase-like acetyltransferase
MENTKRIEYIDCCRGGAMVLVVMSHTTAFPWTVGRIVGSFYMPLFFIISGMLYSTSGRNTWSKTFGRVKRMLAQYVKYMLICDIAYCISIKERITDIQEVVTIVKGFIYSRYFLYPSSTIINIQLLNDYNSALWFITAFIVVILIIQIISVNLLNDIKASILLILTACIFTIVLRKIPILLPWSLDTAPLSCAFYIIGVWIKKKNIISKLELKHVLVLGIALCVLGLLNGGVNYSIRELGKSTFMFVLTSCVGSILMLWFAKMISNRNMRINRGLAYIGKNTMLIMGIHLIFIRCLEYLLEKCNIGFFSTMLGKCCSGSMVALLSILICVGIVSVKKRWLRE